MHVIATAGHVDHGKSTLVRALTGMEPDRLAEERRRGMTIDLGYAWCTLASGAALAFVDVPGHERFVSTMLAGVGPVPAALLVVAADEGWRRQTEEHVGALDALGVSRGVVAVTRSDLADPEPACDEARHRLASTSLAGLSAVPVSSVTGRGLDELRQALETLTSTLPQPDPNAPVRLWIDRCFSIRGSGTVVTGTLAAGTISAGDRLEVAGRRVTVRALQALGHPIDRVSGTARVALNLRGVDTAAAHRGDPLVTPDAWHFTELVDVRSGQWPGQGAAAVPPGQLVLHIGSASTAATVRRLDGSDILRLRLCTALPLRIGDRLLLRDPGSRRVAGATVLDPAPPELRRRGAARARVVALAVEAGVPDLERELSRRGAARMDLLRRIGVDGDGAGGAAVVCGRWVVDRRQWEGWLRRLEVVIGERSEASVLDSGLPAGELVRDLQLPDARLLTALLEACPNLEQEGGRVRRRGTRRTLRPDVEDAVAKLSERLSRQPFAAPEQSELVALGLDRSRLGAAAAAERVLRLAGDVVLLPDAPVRAAATLAGLPQPFTVSAAREALGTTRRVAVPLLEHLDASGLTERVDGGLRRLRAARL